MINKLLSTAVNLYLRSQVSQIQDLQIKITGKNRQLLNGYIPHVFLVCKNAIYQGLHLSQIQVQGTGIAFNLPEVLKKKPLRLLEPIVIAVNLSLDNQDLQASINSDLLQGGLRDLWQIIVAQCNLHHKINQFNQVDNSNLVWDNVAIIEEQLYLSGWYQDDFGKDRKIYLTTCISLLNSHTLCFSQTKIKTTCLETKAEINTDQLSEPIKIDLSTEVNLQQLSIISQTIDLVGTIIVN